MPQFAIFLDNSYHVITLKTTSVTLDGLIISNGYSINDTGNDLRCDNCFGAGIYAPRISDNAVSHNRINLYNMSFYNSNH